MTSDAAGRVLKAHEYLLTLVRAKPDRRFAGGDREAFERWRQEFRGWLCGLLAPTGCSAGVPAAPEVKALSEERWPGCLRTELKFRNADTGLVVPATVLQPRGGRGNGAGVVCQHGHGDFARLAVIGDRRTQELVREIEQHQYDYGLGLAQAGYTIIAIDLLNFGSRAMESLPCRDRCDVVGLWLSLFGLSLAAVQISDIRHAISVLAAWDGIAPERIGMCGLSQGGRMTMFTAAVDERIKVAVAAGSCNTLRDRIARLEGLCGAQVVAGLLPHADTPEVFASVAPRPLQLQWGSRDPLIVEGPAQAGIAHIQSCYAAAGHADHFQVHRFDGGHEFALEPALEWLQRWL
ncbi:MAG TPA: acetylxylan esterase [Armatimonadota bacterium]|nr:acetylxylan esterase [Armatimonadota bacterium]